MLHGLLQGINSPCSFKISMMGFNPSLTSGFSGYCFWWGNMSGFLSFTTTGIAFYARPTDFPSAHTLGFTFCSIKGRERKGSTFMKQRHGPCSVYPSPKGVMEIPARSETRVKTAQNPSCKIKNNWNNTFWLVQTVPLRKRIGKWARGFSKHRINCPSI